MDLNVCGFIVMVICQQAYGATVQCTVNCNNQDLQSNNIELISAPVIGTQPSDVTDINGPPLPPFVSRGPEYVMGNVPEKPKRPPKRRTTLPPHIIECLEGRGKNCARYARLNTEANRRRFLLGKKSMSRKSKAENPNKGQPKTANTNSIVNNQGSVLSTSKTRSDNDESKMMTELDKTKISKAKSRAASKYKKKTNKADETKTNDENKFGRFKSKDDFNLNKLKSKNEYTVSVSGGSNILYDIKNKKQRMTKISKDSSTKAIKSKPSNTVMASFLTGQGNSLVKSETKSSEKQKTQVNVSKIINQKQLNKAINKQHIANIGSSNGVKIKQKSKLMNGNAISGLSLSGSGQLSNHDGLRLSNQLISKLSQGSGPNLSNIRTNAPKRNILKTRSEKSMATAKQKTSQKDSTQLRRISLLSAASKLGSLSSSSKGVTSKLTIPIKKPSMINVETKSGISKSVINKGFISRKDGSAGRRPGIKQKPETRDVLFPDSSGRSGKTFTQNPSTASDQRISQGSSVSTGRISSQMGLSPKGKASAKFGDSMSISQKNLMGSQQNNLGGVVNLVSKNRSNALKSGSVVLSHGISGGSKDISVSGSLRELNDISKSGSSGVSQGGSLGTSKSSGFGRNTFSKDDLKSRQSSISTGVAHSVAKVQFSSSQSGGALSQGGATGISRNQILKDAIPKGSILPGSDLSGNKEIQSFDKHNEDGSKGLNQDDSKGQNQDKSIDKHLELEKKSNSEFDSRNKTSNKKVMKGKIEEDGSQGKNQDDEMTKSNKKSTSTNLGASSSNKKASQVKTLKTSVSGHKSPSGIRSKQVLSGFTVSGQTASGSSILPDAMQVSSISGRVFKGSTSPKQQLSGLSAQQQIGIGASKIPRKMQFSKLTGVRGGLMPEGRKAFRKSVLPNKQRKPSPGTASMNIPSKSKSKQHGLPGKVTTLQNIAAVKNNVPVPSTLTRSTNKMSLPSQTQRLDIIRGQYPYKTKTNEIQKSKMPTGQTVSNTKLAGSGSSSSKPAFLDTSSFDMRMKINQDASKSCSCDNVANNKPEILKATAKLAVVGDRKVLIAKVPKAKIVDTNGKDSFNLEFPNLVIQPTLTETVASPSELFGMNMEKGTGSPDDSDILVVALLPKGSSVGSDIIQKSIMKSLVSKSQKSEQQITSTASISKPSSNVGTGPMKEGSTPKVSVEASKDDGKLKLKIKTGEVKDSISKDIKAIMPNSKKILSKMKINLDASKDDKMKLQFKTGKVTDSISKDNGKAKELVNKIKDSKPKVSIETSKDDGKLKVKITADKLKDSTISSIADSINKINVNDKINVETSKDDQKLKIKIKADISKQPTQAESKTISKQKKVTSTDKDDKTLKLVTNEKSVTDEAFSRSSQGVSSVGKTTKATNELLNKLSVQSTSTKKNLVTDNKSVKQSTKATKLKLKTSGDDGKIKLEIKGVKDQLDDKGTNDVIVPSTKVEGKQKLSKKKTKDAIGAVETKQDKTKTSVSKKQEEDGDQYKIKTSGTKENEIKSINQKLGAKTRTADGMFKVKLTDSKVIDSKPKVKVETSKDDGKLKVTITKGKAKEEDNLNSQTSGNTVAIKDKRIAEAIKALKALKASQSSADSLIRGMGKPMLPDTKYKLPSDGGSLNVLTQTLKKHINIKNSIPSITKTIPIKRVKPEISKQSPAMTLATSSSNTKALMPAKKKPNLQALCLIYLGAFIDSIGYAPYPGECQKLVQCFYLGGKLKAVARECPAGMFWDQTMLLCRPPDDVLCFEDRCLIPGIKHYRRKGGCNCFYQCVDGISVPACCPKGYRYDDDNECVLSDKSDMCDDECETPSILTRRLTETSCPSLPDPMNKYGYLAPQYGGLRIRACPAGTLYSEAQCRCKSNINGNSGSLRKQYRQCSAEFKVNFDGGFKDISKGGLAFDYSHIFLRNGKAVFSGNSKMYIWGFQSRYLGKTFAIRFRVKVNRGAGKYRPEPIISNCGPNGDSSIEISVHRGKMLFKAKTSENPDVISIQKNYDDEKWIDVSYFYDGNYFGGSCNGKTFQQRTGGNLEIRDNPMTIGLCSGNNGFHGEIDELEIYTACIPKDL